MKHADYIYNYIKEKQQVGIKVPKFSADAFLGGLFLTTPMYICKHTFHVIM